MGKEAGDPLHIMRKAPAASTTPGAHARRRRRPRLPAYALDTAIRAGQQRIGRSGQQDAHARIIGGLQQGSGERVAVDEMHSPAMAKQIDGMAEHPRGRMAEGTMLRVALRKWRRSAPEAMPMPKGAIRPSGGLRSAIRAPSRRPS